MDLRLRQDRSLSSRKVREKEGARLGWVLRRLRPERGEACRSA